MSSLDHFKMFFQSLKCVQLYCQRTLPERFWTHIVFNSWSMTNEKIQVSWCVSDCSFRGLWHPDGVVLCWIPNILCTGKTPLAHPQMALTAEMRTEGGWLSWRPLTVAWRNCWMSSVDMAAVKRLAAHRARPRRNGDAAGQGTEKII